MNFDALEKKIKDLQEEHDFLMANLFNQAAKREWLKVCKRNKHIESVMFGNGTHLIVGIDEHRWWKQGAYRDTLSNPYFEQHYIGPKYAWDFVCILAKAEELRICLDDLMRP